MQSLNTGAQSDCGKHCSVMLSCVSFKAEQKGLRTQKKAETVLVVESEGSSGDKVEAIEGLPTVITFWGSP